MCQICDVTKYLSNFCLIIVTYISRMELKNYVNFYFRYNIMLRCWKAKPTLRPSFSELVDSIGDLLEESVKAVRLLFAANRRFPY